MEQHDFLQGSPEWHQHRSTHFNASDAPAMMGVSAYKTRSQLLDELATGVTQEVDEATQRRFDEGHRFEALGRPLAEKIVGKKLYPVVGSEGKYSASFDGLTMDEAICFEHKSLNDSIRAAKSAEELDLQYRIQMEQQLMVAGAERCLFIGSKWNDADELVEEVNHFYYADLILRGQIIEGWAQFEKDMATHQPKVIAEKPKAQVSIELPALFVNAQGAIIDSNMEAFGLALTDKLAEVRAIKLVSDQDFSNAKAAATMFREQYKKLELAKEAMLAQTVTIGEAARMIDAWREDLRVTALQLEKDVEREDLAKKRAIVSEAGLAFSAHIEALEAETRPIQLNIVRPDFATAIKGKRNYTSMQDAIDTLLSQSKQKADAAAKDVRDKLAWCKEHAAGHSGLFPDLQQIIIKPMEDFTLTISSRIDAQKKAEAERMEAERARIQAEEEAKARAKVEAEERERIAAEAKARIEAETKPAADLPTSIPAVKQEVSAPERSLLEKAQRLSGAGTTQKPRPTDDAIINTISCDFGVTFGQACDWIIEIAEALKVAA